jgi:hypothetical protein
MISSFCSLSCLGVEELEHRLASSRKYALQLEGDNATLKRGMEETMNRLKNFSSDENLVDRRIVNKLLVAYFDHHATDEVLQLMAKLLQFTDEEHRKVIESQRSRGVFGSLTSFLPSPFTPETNQSFADDDDKNIADLWVKFLLEETGSGPGNNNQPASGSVPEQSSETASEAKNFTSGQESNSVGASDATAVISEAPELGGDVEPPQ